MGVTLWGDAHQIRVSGDVSALLAASFDAAGRCRLALSSGALVEVRREAGACRFAVIAHGPSTARPRVRRLDAGDIVTVDGEVEWVGVAAPDRFAEAVRDPSMAMPELPGLVADTLREALVGARDASRARIDRAA